MNTKLTDPNKSAGMKPWGRCHQIDNFKNGSLFYIITAPAYPRWMEIKSIGFKRLEHTCQLTLRQQAIGWKSRKNFAASGLHPELLWRICLVFSKVDGDLSKSTFVQKFMNKHEKFAFYDDLKWSDWKVKTAV